MVYQFAVTVFCPSNLMALTNPVLRKKTATSLFSLIVVISQLSAWGHLQRPILLDHTRYYRKFIKAYAHISAPMEKLLKKDVMFFLDDDCHKILDTLKEKMVTMPILVFLD